MYIVINFHFRNFFFCFHQLGNWVAIIPIWNVITIIDWSLRTIAISKFDGRWFKCSVTHREEGCIEWSQLKMVSAMYVLNSFSPICAMGVMCISGNIRWSTLITSHASCANTHTHQSETRCIQKRLAISLHSKPKPKTKIKSMHIQYNIANHREREKARWRANEARISC